MRRLFRASKAIPRFIIHLMKLKRPQTMALLFARLFTYFSWWQLGLGHQLWLTSMYFTGISLGSKLHAFSNDRSLAQTSYWRTARCFLLHLSSAKSLKKQSIAHFLLPFELTSLCKGRACMLKKRYLTVFSILIP